jgi:hypothetical protein
MPIRIGLERANWVAYWESVRKSEGSSAVCRVDASDVNPRDMP